MSALEWTVFVTGFTYVILAALNNSWCWVWGIVSCALLSYLSFTKYLLFADGVLQILYVLMGFWGIYSWQKIKQEEEIPIRSLTLIDHGILVIIGLVVSLICGYLLATYTPAFATYLDSATTVFGLIATVLLINKYIGNWVYWIIIDLVMAALYFQRDGTLTGMLMLIYMGFAILGLYLWVRRFKSSV